ncbi:MAG: HAMP domain-containing methyl-accepting chemotaxis protein, partial [Pseudomonadota bacterium]
FGPGLLNLFKQATGIDAALHLLRDQGELELAATTSDTPLIMGAEANSWNMGWLRGALEINQVDARVALDNGRAGVISFPLPDYNNTIIGTLTLQIPAGIKSDVRFVDSLFVAAIPILLIIVIIAFQAIIGGIVKPLGRLSEVMTAMSRDQISTEIPDRERTDEIGTMARSLVVFQDHIAERFRIATAAKRQKEVDQQARDDEMRELSAEFDATVRKVADSITQTSLQINSAATATAGRSDTGSVDAIGVANTAQSILEGAQSIAGSAEELAASVTEINQQAISASELSDEALRDVGTAQSQIEQLAGSVDQIRNVVALIEDIAEQTNLLALNATIEAARAGEAGKGFAVVAAEVKQLATQTGQATESIGQQIAAIMSESEQAVEAMRRVDSITNRMQEISTAIAGAVEEQGAVTREIASQISHSSTEIDTLSAGVSAIAMTVVRTCGKSIEVLWEADGLEQRSQELADESSRFLKVIKA